MLECNGNIVDQSRGAEPNCPCNQYWTLNALNGDKCLMVDYRKILQLNGIEERRDRGQDPFGGTLAWPDQITGVEKGLR